MTINDGRLVFADALNDQPIVSDSGDELAHALYAAAALLRLRWETLANVAAHSDDPAALEEAHRAVNEVSRAAEAIYAAMVGPLAAVDAPALGR